ncbi:MAG: hypothetical protein HYR66_17380 [Sphingobacteriales bacterium]|nr:hypothetical protein [Sphingobacteriales bacterium]MBI3719739.1 hypothetical protein [Sphingobacteriales bacterium]
MKVQESLSLFLYETKKLTLPGIGHFTLDPAVNVFDKTDPSLLPNAIQFIPDTKAEEVPELINHLVKTTGKMKPLAISDLDSFLSTGKQLLNIGKPFIIPGVGSLNKTRDGIQFTSGQIIPAKIETAPAEHKLRDKTIEEPNFSSVEKEFDYEEGSRRTSKKWLILLATGLVLAIAGWAVYYFMFANKGQKENTEVTNEPSTTDTSSAVNIPDTTATKKIDTLATKPASITAIPDSIVYTYAVQLRQYTYAKSANARQQELKSYGHKVFVEAQDSAHYNILMPINGSLTDSTKVIDSLYRLFKPLVRPFARLKQ